MTLNASCVLRFSFAVVFDKWRRGSPVFSLPVIFIPCPVLPPLIVFLVPLMCVCSIQVCGGGFYFYFF